MISRTIYFVWFSAMYYRVACVFDYVSCRWLDYLCDVDHVMNLWPDCDTYIKLSSCNSFFRLCSLWDIKRFASSFYYPFLHQAKLGQWWYKSVTNASPDRSSLWWVGSETRWDDERSWRYCVHVDLFDIIKMNDNFIVELKKQRTDDVQEGTVCSMAHFQGQDSGFIISVVFSYYFCVC